MSSISLEHFDLLNASKIQHKKGLLKCKSDCVLHCNQDLAPKFFFQIFHLKERPKKDIKSKSEYLLSYWGHLEILNGPKQYPQECAASVFNAS